MFFDIKHNFCGFIWSPAKEYLDEILEYINKKYHVLHFYNYQYDNKHDYEKSILDIYTTDDIDPIKVKNVKIKNMMKTPLCYTYFKFYIAEPKFRLKASTGNKISCVVEDIKKSIRTYYNGKIKNYIHDIIIHISDNFTQTTQIEEIMNKYKGNQISECINLKHFLRCNFKNSIFDRADTLIRKYSIEQYLKDSNYDFLFYKKMQKIRTGLNPENYVIKFKKLINSLQTNGFNNKFPIKYSKQYLLRDGSHRLSYLLIKKPTFITIKHKIWDNHSTYSKQWFIDNKFNNNAIKIIDNELEQLNKFLYI